MQIHVYNKKCINDMIGTITNEMSTYLYLRTKNSSVLSDDGSSKSPDSNLKYLLIEASMRLFSSTPINSLSNSLLW